MENVNRLSRAHERCRQTDRDRPTDRPTDRQTDGRRHIANVNVSSLSLKIVRTSLNKHLTELCVKMLTSPEMIARTDCLGNLKWQMSRQRRQQPLQNLIVDFVSLATLSSVRVVRCGSSSVNSSGSIEGRLSNIKKQQKIMLCWSFCSTCDYVANLNCKYWRLTGFCLAGSC